MWVFGGGGGGDGGGMLATIVTPAFSIKLTHFEN